MRLSHLLGTTRRPDAADTGLSSHDFLLRGAYFRRLGPGQLASLPLGTRVQQQLLNQLSGALGLPPAAQLHLPPGHSDQGIYDHALEPLDDPYHLRSWLEVARQEIQSYRQLPLLAWRKCEVEVAGNKAKGLYGESRRNWLEMGWFAASESEMQEQGKQLQQAWKAYMDSLGLEMTTWEAEAGISACPMAHGWGIWIEGGESELGEGENGWQSLGLLSQKVKATEAEPLPLEKIHTPGTKTIADLATFLEVPASQTAKVVFYAPTERDPRLVMVLVRGDHAVNELAVKRTLGRSQLEPASEADILQAGSVPGYASPIGLDLKRIRLLVDDWVAQSPNLAAGANETDFHYRNACYGRDFEGGEVGAFALWEGATQSAIEIARSLSIGSAWSDQLEVRFTTDQGKSAPISFGYFRIDLSQFVLALAERSQDEQGLHWPMALAPYQIQLISLADGEVSITTANQLYDQLQQAGYSVLYDDRHKKVAGPGVKFKDADLRGIPLRITVAKRALKEGGVEVKLRGDTERRIIPLTEVLDWVRANP
ncbi:MAG: YbaK/EbsC family protein [Bacteroidota bacterium]